MNKEEKLILSILEDSEEPLSTKEVEERARKKEDCPDKPSHILNRLYWKKKIKRDFKKGKWLWWV